MSPRSEDVDREALINNASRSKYEFLQVRHWIWSHRLIAIYFQVRPKTEQKRLGREMIQTPSCFDHLQSPGTSEGRQKPDQYIALVVDDTGRTVGYSCLGSGGGTGYDTSHEESE